MAFSYRARRRNESTALRARGREGRIGPVCSEAYSAEAVREAFREAVTGAVQGGVQEFLLFKFLCAP